MLFYSKTLLNVNHFIARFMYKYNSALSGRPFFLRKIDGSMYFQILILCLIGVAALYSAAVGSFEPWALKQLITIALFAPAAILVAHLNSRTIYENTYLVYIIALIFLAIAAIFGHKAMGAQRWLRIGVINFQPSEFMKLGLIIALAKYFHSLHTNEIGRIRRLVMPIVMTLVPALFILKQPNLGTATILLLIAAAIFFTAGVKAWKFIVCIVGAVSAMPVVWHFLHPYQKQRVLTFLNPEADPLGSGYNIIQSIIAIGSGGFFGKGFLEGSQSQLSFLPEKQTDFILSVVAEEFGFLGVLVVLLLTMSIVFSCYKAAFSSTSQFFRLTAIGVGTSFALHALINAGMISGLLPVVGMPYPLLSFGGSNLGVFLLAFGLVMNRKLATDKY